MSPVPIQGTNLCAHRQFNFDNFSIFHQHLLAPVCTSCTCPPHRLIIYPWNLWAHFASAKAQSLHVLPNILRPSAPPCFGLCLNKSTFISTRLPMMAKLVQTSIHSFWSLRIGRHKLGFVISSTFWNPSSSNVSKLFTSFNLSDPLDGASPKCRFCRLTGFSACFPLVDHQPRRRARRPLFFLDKKFLAHLHSHRLKWIQSTKQSSMCDFRTRSKVSDNASQFQSKKSSSTPNPIG